MVLIHKFKFFMPFLLVLFCATGCCMTNISVTHDDDHVGYVEFGRQEGTLVRLIAKVYEVVDGKLEDRGYQGKWGPTCPHRIAMQPGEHTFILYHMGGYVYGDLSEETLSKLKSSKVVVNVEEDMITPVLIVLEHVSSTRSINYISEVMEIHIEVKDAVPYQRDAVFEGKSPVLGG